MRSVMKFVSGLPSVASVLKMSFSSCRAVKLFPINKKLCDSEAGARVSAFAPNAHRIAANPRMTGGQLFDFLIGKALFRPPTSTGNGATRTADVTGISFGDFDEVEDVFFIVLIDQGEIAVPGAFIGKRRIRDGDTLFDPSSAVGLGNVYRGFVRIV